MELARGHSKNGRATRCSSRPRNTTHFTFLADCFVRVCVCGFGFFSSSGHDSALLNSRGFAKSRESGFEEKFRFLVLLAEIFRTTRLDCMLVANLYSGTAKRRYIRSTFFWRQRTPLAMNSALYVAMGCSVMQLFSSVLSHRIHAP